MWGGQTLLGGNLPEEQELRALRVRQLHPILLRPHEALRLRAGRARIFNTFTVVVH
jgi:hypothetical protein